ncbi:MAG: GDP-mannose 4,6-dehydratase [Thermodesulfobacteriota bacterium]
MDILVTGGAGFIGSHLVERLIERGDRVTVIDNFNDFYDPALKEENIKGFCKNPLFRLYRGDIRDASLIKRIFDKNPIDRVFHLAARAGVRPSIQEPILYEEVNCIGTLNLLEACRKNGIKHFIFGSSSSVYGINSKVPFSEDDSVNMPISPYAATKRAGELLCSTYSHLYGIPVTALRFFTVYGEKQRPEMAIRKFTNLIWEGKEVPVYGDGGSRRDYTYISDIIQGLLASMDLPDRVRQSGKPFGFEIINLGESRTVELKYLISLIENGLNKKAILKTLPVQPGDVPITYADVSKAKRLLGYTPGVSIEEGVERFIRWFLKREKG